MVAKCEAEARGAGTVVVVDLGGVGESKVGSNPVAWLLAKVVSKSFSSSSSTTGAGAMSANAASKSSSVTSFFRGIEDEFTTPGSAMGGDLAASGAYG